MLSLALLFIFYGRGQHSFETMSHRFALKGVNRSTDYLFPRTALPAVGFSSA